MGYQNFYATKLFTEIGTSDTIITLETPPTVTSGRLVLEARNSSQKEIIKYTGVLGNQVTGVTRGQGGTTAKIHAKNALVEMNVTAEDLAEALAVPIDIVDKWDKVFTDYVQSGFVWSIVSGLNGTMTVGIAYITGVKTSVAAIASRAFTVSKDTYVDVGNNGTIYYSEVANGAASPALAADRMRLAQVVTSASAITSVFNYQNGVSFAQESSWVNNQLPVPTSVTYNGNRSYTNVYPSSVLSYTSEGMRKRFTRTVSAPTYMGGLMNGTSHYFTKTTPTSTLSTVTNNFTLMAWVELTAYPAGTTTIIGRADVAANNALALRIVSNGTVNVTVVNGGPANYRDLTTYQSLPLNKKTHVTASWTSGTAVVYFDGVSVPIGPANTGGTAPTVAGTGGDFSVGRYGSVASQYSAGYISGVGVFDAVLTAATIKSYSSQALIGTETNCIGAWSLNNTGVNQQAAGTNDLTATGGVSYTVRSPYGNYLGGTLEYAIVTAISSDGLTETVQVPEGCAIPTSGGISAVAYSTQKVPYRFPGAESRWFIEVRLKTQQTTGNVASASTITNLAGMYIDTPVGSGEVSLIVYGLITHVGATNLKQTLGLSTSSSSFVDTELVRFGSSSAPSSGEQDSLFISSKDILNTTTTKYYLNSQGSTTNTTQYYSGVGGAGDGILKFRPAYL